MKNIILFGIQGSGKGTQAKKLADSLGYVIFETGARLRESARENSPLGNELRETMNAGKLVSTEIIMNILQDFLSRNADKKIIFDGIPRNKEQHDLFEPLMTAHQLQPLAIQLQLEKNEAIQRMEKRAKIENRSDDNIATMKKRIEIFFSETLPVIETYQKKGLLHCIDGTQPIDTVYEEIKKQIL